MPASAERTRPVSKALFLGLVVLLGAWVGWSACGGARPRQPTLTSDQERGRLLYTQYCVQCHGGATGGRMMDIPPPHNANGHTWHHPDCQLKDVVLNGSGEMGEMMRRMMGASENTPRMPAFKDTLSEAEVMAVLAHIKTWWTPEQRAWQTVVTQAQC